MHIGELAERTGHTAKAIRYYERIGLLGEPERTASGYRCYGETNVRLLKFIAIAKAAGLTLDEIAAILKASSQAQIDCGQVRTVLEVNLAQVKQRLADIQALYDAMEHTIEAVRRHELRAPAGEYDCPLVERVVDERTATSTGARRSRAPKRKPASASV